MEGSQLLCFFCMLFAIVFTIVPVKIAKIYDREFCLNMTTAPVLSLLPIFATGIFDVTNVFHILNEGSPNAPGLSMIRLLLMFQSLAYLCMSVDETGLFEYITLKLLRKYGRSLFSLFNVVFVVSSVLTVVSSNDIVIMTLTPMIYYAFSNINVTDPKSSEMGMVPFLTAQFMAANTWSTILTISNPTNILVAEACKWSFTDYLSSMFLPSIIGGSTLYCCLWLRYGRYLDRSPLQLKSDSIVVGSSKDLQRQKAAIIGGVLIILCLATMIIFSNYPIWIVIISFAGAMFLVDLAGDIIQIRDRRLQRISKELNIEMRGLKEETQLSKELEDIHTSKELDEIQISKGSRSFVWAVLCRLPWSLIPFASGMFLLVLALEKTGFLFAFVRPIFLFLSDKGLFALIVGVSFLASLSANLLNNQPMTLLWTISCLSIPISNAWSQKYQRLALFSVVLASNYGGNLTPIGALAGIMWMSILKDLSRLNPQQPTLKPMNVREFIANGFLIMPFVTFIASCAIFITNQ